MTLHSLFFFLSFVQHLKDFGLALEYKAHLRQGKVGTFFGSDLNCAFSLGLNHHTTAQPDFWSIRFINLSKENKIPSHMTCTFTVNEPCARAIIAQCMTSHEKLFICVIVFFNNIGLVMILLRLSFFQSTKLLCVANLVTIISLKIGIIL